MNLLKRFKTLWALSSVEVEEPSPQSKTLAAVTDIFKKKPLAEVIKYERQTPVQKIINDSENL